MARRTNRQAIATEAAQALEFRRRVTVTRTTIRSVRLSRYWPADFLKEVCRLFLFERCNMNATLQIGDVKITRHDNSITVSGPWGTLVRMHTDWQTAIWPDWRESNQASRLHREIDHCEGEKHFSLSTTECREAVMVAIQKLLGL